MRALGPVAAVLIALMLVASSAMFTVDQRQNAIVFQLGEVKEVIVKPGLHFKWPLVETARVFDRRLQVLDAERDLFDAELALARLQRDELLNIVGLYRALGGGWNSGTGTADVRAGSAALVKPAAGQ